MLNKYQFTKELLQDDRSPISILDIGCRDKVLKNYLGELNISRYQGLDLGKNDLEILNHDLESGIPFEDNEFDYVIALDVLEHVDNIHELYREMLRVSKKGIIAALPNQYYWKFRLKYLLGREIDEKKYRLHHFYTKDRHRWVTSFNSSIEFFEKNTPVQYLVRFNSFYSYRSRWKFLYKFDKFFGKYFPNFCAYELFCKVSKT